MVHSVNGSATGFPTRMSQGRRHSPGRGAGSAGVPAGTFPTCRRGRRRSRASRGWERRRPRRHFPHLPTRTSAFPGVPAGTRGWERRRPRRHFPHLPTRTSAFPGGDYHYAFDPKVRLRHLLDKGAGSAVMLVDEAHNLPERARESFSASLSRRSVARAGAAFPSYDYPRTVLSAFAGMAPDVDLAVQQPGMTEADRSGFLARFSGENRHTLVGFAVLGGIFGEGIDLVPPLARLSGAAVVGVGLPPVTAERELIRKQLDAGGMSGYDVAYRVPGWTRVLQAAGRVVRSERDRGAVLLIDERLALPAWTDRFPESWRPRRVDGPAAVVAAIGRFWAETPIEI